MIDIATTTSHHSASLRQSNGRVLSESFAAIKAAADHHDDELVLEASTSDDSSTESSSRSGDDHLHQQGPAKAQLELSAMPVWKAHRSSKNSPVEGRIASSHDNSSYDYQDPSVKELLQGGGTLFSFSCQTWSSLSSYNKKMVESVANVSGFEDETVDNMVPAFDLAQEEVNKGYTYILQRSAYILPGVKLDQFTPQALSAVEYHKACQPHGTIVWENVTDEDTFRISKPIIPYLYNMTIQFKASNLEEENLRRLSHDLLGGLPVHHGTVLERTKRHKAKQDATAKAKSVLLYTKIPGGVLVTHITAILNRSVPSIVAPMIDSFGSMGLRESRETVQRTRAYLLDSNKR